LRQPRQILPHLLFLFSSYCTSDYSKAPAQLPAVTIPRHRLREADPPTMAWPSTPPPAAHSCHLDRDCLDGAIQHGFDLYQWHTPSSTATWCRSACSRLSICDCSPTTIAVSSIRPLRPLHWLRPC
jgi:hypothetical protein